MNIYFNPFPLFEIMSKRWTLGCYWKWHLGYYPSLNKYDWSAYLIGPFQLKIWKIK